MACAHYFQCYKCEMSEKMSMNGQTISKSSLKAVNSLYKTIIMIHKPAEYEVPVRVTDL